MSAASIGAAGDRPPGAQQQRVGRARRDLLDVVGDQHHGGRTGGAGKLGERRDEPLARAEVEPGGGLVEQEQVGVRQQCAGDLDPLTLAGREGPEPAVGEGSHAQSLEQLSRPRAVRLAEVVPPGGQRRLARRHHQLDRGEPGVHPGRQRRACVADPSPQVAGVHGSEPLPEHLDRPGRRPELGRGDLEQRRLARAVRAARAPSARRSGPSSRAGRGSSRRSGARSRPASATTGAPTGGAPGAVRHRFRDDRRSGRSPAGGPRADRAGR